MALGYWYTSHKEGSCLNRKSMLLEVIHYVVGLACIFIATCIIQIMNLLQQIYPILCIC